MRSNKHIEKKQKRKRIFETALSLFILLAIFLGFVTGYYGSKVLNFLDSIGTEEPESMETLENTKQLEDLEPFSAVILGVDVEEDGASRSDTIIVVTVNPDSKDIKMLSIPRDTLITLPNGVTEKINAAHSVGGPLLAKEMISSYLDIPIQFYATMDFDGLIGLVDAVGGVTINSEFAFTQSLYQNSGQSVQIIEGEQELNGDEALAYARMRKSDPRGDFGRQDRQQEVVAAILDKVVSVNTVANFTNILDAIEPHLSTNVTASQMMTIAANYMNTAGNIEQIHLNGYAGTEYFPHYGLDVYTWQPYEDSLFEVQNELKEHLGLEVDEGAEDADEAYIGESYEEADADSDTY